MEKSKKTSQIPKPDKTQGLCDAHCFWTEVLAREFERDWKGTGIFLK